MAEIRVLPVRSCGPEQTDRLYADLATAHARGEPLGSRVPHIQAGGEQLVLLIHELKDVIDELDRMLTRLDLQDPTAIEALRHFVAAAQEFADAAQRYSPGA